MTSYERSFGRGLWHSLNVVWLGEALLLSDKVEEAHSVAKRALALTRELKHRTCELWTLRLLGDIAARRETPDGAVAECYYHQVLEFAAALEMRPLVACCHFGLGSLYRRTGNGGQAREHIKSATTMFRDMDMQFWLQKADGEIRERGYA